MGVQFLGVPRISLDFTILHEYELLYTYSAYYTYVHFFVFFGLNIHPNYPLHKINRAVGAIWSHNLSSLVFFFGSKTLD